MSHLFMEWILDPLDGDDAYVDSSAYDNIVERMLFRYSIAIVACAASCSLLFRPRWSLERLAMCTAGALAGIAATGIVLIPAQAVSVWNTDKNPFGEFIELGIEVGVRPSGGFGGLIVWVMCVIAVSLVRPSRPRLRNSLSLSSHPAQSD